MLAGVVGTLVLIIFMLITYGRFGVYADLALLVNVLMILGIMAVFNATLTLPGIAGFVLTIGTAVDANVLINERIREEQRVRDRNAIESVEFGYKEASRTIFDANITNVISARHHVRVRHRARSSGFAVVLLIGIVTSVFTARHLHPDAGRAMAAPRAPETTSTFEAAGPCACFKLDPRQHQHPVPEVRNGAIALSSIC